MVSCTDKMALRQKIILILFLIIGTIFQIIPTVKSGLNYQFGIGFWGPSGHDGVWHLSLINHIENPLKINMPVFSGEKLINYHPFFDILISSLSKITKIRPSFWLFQLFPLISSFIFLYLSFLIGYKITNLFYGGIILLGLNTLANSFGWVVSLFRFGNFSGESIFWAMQSPSNQINPPYILSVIFLEIIILLILNNLNKSKIPTSQLIVFFIILSIIPITKAYSAIPAFSLFGFYSIRSAIKSKSLKIIFFYFFTLITSVTIFIHYNPNTSGILVYQPFWFINSMIESIDRIYLPHLANIRYSGAQTGNVFKVIFASSISLLIFIIGNFAWRILGLIKLPSKSNFIHNSLLANIILLTLIPVLFIQKGTSWNTIQFLYYALFLSNILLSNFLVDASKYLTILIFSTYLFAFFGNINNYIGEVPPASIPSEEVKALTYLSTLPKGIVLTVPYDPHLKDKFESTPIPLYAYETTAYVSAFGKQFTYLEDEMNLNNSGYDYVSRRKQSINFFTQKNIFQDRGFLVNNQIKYIYIAGKQQPLVSLDSKNLYLTLIFQNSDATIYEVQR